MPRRRGLHGRPGGGRQVRQNRGKEPAGPDVTHCSFDVDAAAFRLRRGEGLFHARAYSRYHFLHPVRLGHRPSGPFFPPAADPRLPYRRVRHWSIRHGLGQVAGIDQRHFRTRPDLHAVHDRAGNRPEEDRAGRPGDPVRRRRPVGRRLRARPAVFHGHRPSGGFDAVYLTIACALSSHGHHRQGVVREARARHAARPHHARRAGAAGHLRHPVPGGAAEPRRSPGQRDPVLGRPGRLAGGDRAGAEPLRPAETVSPDRAPSRTDPARRAGVVLPDRRDRRAAASVARNGIAGGRGLAVDIPLCARRHRQGHDAARFLHHAVLCRLGHDDPDPRPVGDLARARHRGLHGDQPRG